MFEGCSCYIMSYPMCKLCRAIYDFSKLASVQINAICRKADVPLLVTTTPTKESETRKMVVFLALIAVKAFLHVRMAYPLLHRWCARRSIPGSVLYPTDIESRTRKMRKRRWWVLCQVQNSSKAGSETHSILTLPLGYLAYKGPVW